MIKPQLVLPKPKITGYTSVVETDAEVVQSITGVRTVPYGRRGYSIAESGSLWGAS